MVKSSVTKPKLEKLETVQLSFQLGKQLKHLEKISGKSKEFIFQEALLRCIEELEKTPKVSNLKKMGQEKELTVKLPKEWADHVEYLGKTTSKDKNYYVREALYRYLESLQELQTALDVLKNGGKTYSSDEANKKLGI